MVKTGPPDGAVPDRSAKRPPGGIGAAGLEYEERVALLSLEELDADGAAQAALMRVAAAGDYDGRASS